MLHLVSVRFGQEASVENFVTDLADLRDEEKCVVRTDRGLELGEVVSTPDPLPEGLSPEIFPNLVRRAAFDDLLRAEEMESRRVAATVYARAEAERLRLQIEIREVEITWGGDRMDISFVKLGLMNLTPLFHSLSERFGARVEFRQIALKDAGGGCGDGG